MHYHSATNRDNLNRFFVIRCFPLGHAAGLWILGLFWTVLITAFELSFGFIRGLSRETLLSDYNLLKGRIWIHVLISTLISLVLAGRFREKI